MPPSWRYGGSSELSKIIASTDFRSVVTETHSISADKTLCPFHQDSSPSCHIYDDSFHCYACGAHGDVLDWLEQVHGLSKADAIKELERRSGMATAQTVKPVSKPKATCKGCEAKPFTDALHVKYWQRLEQLTEIPRALQNRGFSIHDCKILGIAANGDAAVLAIPDPLGNIVALKQRHFVAKEGQSRYTYLTKGCGTPAWCSPCFFVSQRVLIIEGELNAMSCAVVRRNGDEDLAVMGVAGTSGCLWLEALKDKDVYVYGDGDKPGQEAREKWALAAHNVGAKSVFTLEPWDMDANDILVKLGPDELRERIL
jgi:DNA primase